MATGAEQIAACRPMQVERRAASIRAVRRILPGGRHARGAAMASEPGVTAGDAARPRPARARLALVGLGVLLALAGSAAWLWVGLADKPAWSQPSASALWLRQAAVALALTGPLGLAVLAALHLRDARANRAALRQLAVRQQRGVRRLLDALHLPVALCNADLQRAWINRALAELLHADRADAVDQTWDWQAYLDPASWPEWAQAVAAVHATGRPQELRARFRHGGADSEWLVRLTPIEDAAGAGAAVAVELRGAEDAMAQDAVDRMRGLLAAAEAEKWQFGQAVHDELGQRLSGMAFFAKALQRKLQGAQRPEADDAGWLVDLANESMAVARTLARGLNPVGSDDPAALEASLGELCRNTGRMFGVECTLEADDGFDPGGSGRANHLYHAVQELITNAVRHGGARHIGIRLEAGPLGQRIRVRNDGAALGDVAAASRRGMGLSGVRSRVAHLEGQFRLADDPGGGVLATIELPPPVPPGAATASTAATETRAAAPPEADNRGAA